MHIMICFKQNCIQTKQMINCILAVHTKICDNSYCMTICLCAVTHWIGCVMTV